MASTRTTVENLFDQIDTLPFGPQERALVDEAIRVAEALEIARVYVHIHARNVPSLAAYHRAGFRFSHWWTDDADPMLSAERQWRVFERML